MTNLDYAALAAKVLKQKPTSVRTTALSRDRGIAIVAQAMQQSVKSRSRRKQRLWISAAAITMAAAAAAAVVGTRGFTHSKATASVNPHCAHSPEGCSPSVKNAQGTVDVGHYSGRDILPGGVIQAAVGQFTQVRFDSGTRLALGGNTRLAYDEGTEVHRFSLSHGSVHLEVTKLKQGQRFLVNTADAEVEVRGTVFDVSVIPASEGCAERTSVAVKEGVVEVRSTSGLRTLHGGDTWQPECATALALKEPAAHAARPPIAERTALVGPNVELSARKDGQATAERAVVEERATAGESAGAAPTQTQSEQVRSSDLAKQNDIYARASAERNQGHSLEALTLYQELITKFPSSALTESACVQRIRILRTTNSAAAAREAKLYLSRFPKGFARSEAEALLSAP